MPQNAAFDLVLHLTALACILGVNREHKMGHILIILSLYFTLNQSFSLHAKLLSKAMCLVFQLKFPLGHLHE